MPTIDPIGPNTASRGHIFDPSILRACDIRGTVGRTLCNTDAYFVGRAFGTIVAPDGGNRVVVGNDGRLSSLALAAALSDGLAASGVSVFALGLTSSPMCYFAAEQLAADGTVVVTDSHNPAFRNGFKLVLGAARFFGEDLLGLRRLIALGDSLSDSDSGQTHDVIEACVPRLLEEVPESFDLAIAWDLGNGAAGLVTERLAAALPGRHVVINQTVDGTFPSHHPDQSGRQNLDQLADIVTAQRCDYSIAFDGDGDRIGEIRRTCAQLAGDVSRHF